MPDSQDVFRFRGQIVWTLVGGVFLTLVFTVAAFGRAGPALGAFAALTLAVSIRMALMRVSVDARGVCVRNVFGSRCFAWAEIDRFELGRFKLLSIVGIVVLRDGSTYHASAIAPKPRVASQVDEARCFIDAVNARLAEARETPSA
jgi:hypothetical protein